MESISYLFHGWLSIRSQKNQVVETAKINCRALSTYSTVYIEDTIMYRRRRATQWLLRLFDEGVCRITHWCLKFVYCVTTDSGHLWGYVAISKPKERSILFNPYILVRNEASVSCFLSSWSLLPPARTAVFGSYPVIFLLLTNAVSPNAGLPYHMMREVSWNPKGRRSWAS